MNDILKNPTAAGSRTMTGALRLAASVACFSLLASGAHAQVFVGFEQDEGFTQLNTAPSGQGNPAWTGSPAGTGTNANLRIVNTEAYAGTQSLAATNGSGQFYYTISPNLYNLTGASSSASIRFKVTDITPALNASIARFEAYYGTSDQPGQDGHYRVTATLHYNNSDLNGPYRVNFTSNGVTEGMALMSGELVDLSEWNEMVMSFNFEARTVTFSVIGENGAMATVTRNLASNADIDKNTRITYIRLGVNGSSTGTVYYDNLTIIPEPGHAAMLGGAMVLGLALAGRHLRKRK